MSTLTWIILLSVLTAVGVIAWMVYSVCKMIGKMEDMDHEEQTSWIGK